MDYIEKYFADLGEDKKEKLTSLSNIYKDVNDKINVISRRDIENFDLHHLLPALAIAKLKSFERGDTVLDIGSGGGLPGIPLAIAFPDTKFTLTDSRSKKTEATKMVLAKLGLDNVEILNKRSNEIKERYDYVIGRAVTNVNDFMTLATKNLKDPKKDKSVFYIAGQDDSQIRSFLISKFYSEEYFINKCVYVK